MIKVFVYGTLLSGEGNNRLLKEAKLLGECEATGFIMFNMGYFPACVQCDDKLNVKGEVWEINENILDRLDRLEGYPSFYDRLETDTKFGKAWIYTNRVGVDYPVITNGDWKKRNEVIE